MFFSANKLLYQNKAGYFPVIALTALFLSMETFAETRGFAVTYLHIANLADSRNCPGGGNGNTGDVALRAYKARGFSQSKIDALLAGKEGGNVGERYLLILERGIRNGKPANVQHYPESQPDPHLEMVSSPVAYGFDLDGKGPGTPGSFTDPETGLQGVDNQLFRAVGCFNNYNRSLPERPSWEASAWKAQTLTKAVPALLFSLTADNLNRDGPASVTFYKGIGHIRRDSLAEGLANLTYVIDPNPRYYGTFKGQIRDGIFVSDTDGVDVFLESRFPMYARLELFDAQLRFKLSADGKVAGYLGGYHNWMDQWFLMALAGDSVLVDVTGGYYNMKKLADARPDPETGENTAISATFRVDAIPAYLARPDGSFITANQ